MRTILGLVAALLLAIVAWPVVASAGPPPVDPKQMSGLSRPDPEVPAGAISVRVLLGSFEEPALEHEVTLHVANADGSKVESLTQTTGNQGRVTFENLKEFIGGQAVAEVAFDGVTMRSQPIALQDDVGSRVMLVKGAKKPPMDVPIPGVAFEFPKSPAGTLMVGAFDLSKGAGISGIEVTLVVTPPQGEVIEKKATTDGDGRATFDDLLPPAVAEGTTFRVKATLVAGGPVKQSGEFTMKPEVGMAVLLAEGRLPGTATAPRDPHQPGAAAAPKRLPGPRTMPSLPHGAVRVRLVDGRDQPVVDQPVTVIKKNASGTDIEFPGTTGKDGVALVQDVAVESDSFYLVGVTYDGAPYSSGFFQLDKAGGVAVDLRVWEVTGDPSVVSSMLEYQVHGGENDMAQVIQRAQALVKGDKAFWPPGGLRIDAQPGAKGLTLLGQSEAWLDHEEKADFVTLSRPMPPGEIVDLSIGFLVEHDGTIEIAFQPPFPTVQTIIAVPLELELEASGARPAEGESKNPDLAIYELPARAALAPLSFQVSGLPIRNPIYKRLAIGLGVTMALALLFGATRRPRGSAKERLEARKAQLLGLLAQAPNAGPRRDRIVTALDRIYRQLEALDGAGGGSRSS
jgi:5-hydroxyisourate hydrolase-like protein (transthyretin family)